MILLCGIPTERPLALVAERLDQLGASYVVLNQRRFAECELELDIDRGVPAGLLRTPAGRWPLADVRAVYARLMDHRELPEVRGLAAGASALAHCSRLHERLALWLELTPARVVNRAAPQASNGSKPFQSQLIARAGLRVPETLVTNDPDAVRQFRDRHGRMIYKSISGVRSIVREFEEEDLARLDSIRWCPVQFQAYVPGHDVRVHCIGGEVFATAIRSAATDYRYGHLDGEPANLTAVDLDAGLATRCVALTRALGLEFAGLDLRITPDGEAYCFEANPSPAFSYYEAHTGQPIAEALARHLTDT